MSVGAVHGGARAGRARDDRGRTAEAPSQIPARGWRDVLSRVREGMKEDHVTLEAAGVAFYGFLAVVPALAATVGVLGLVVDGERARRLVEDLFGGLPTDARQLLSDQLARVSERSAGSLSLTVIVAIVLSLWAASGGVGHLLEAVGSVYGEDDDRGFVRKKLVALAFTLGALGYVLVAGFLIGVLPALLRSLELPGPVRWLIAAAAWPVLAVLMMAGLAVLYRKGPDRDDAEWRWVSWGAVVAVVLWIAGSIAFQVYAANFASYDQTYGSLAAIVVLLMWLWISALAVLVGAEVNAEIEHQTVVDTTTGADRPLGARGAEMADTVGRTADEADDDERADDHGARSVRTGPC